MTVSMEKMKEMINLRRDARKMAIRVGFESIATTANSYNGKFPDDVVSGATNLTMRSFLADVVKKIEKDVAIGELHVAMARAANDVEILELIEEDLAESTRLLDVFKGDLEKLEKLLTGEAQS